MKKTSSSFSSSPPAWEGSSLSTNLLDCAVGPRRLSLGKSVESPLHAAARRDHLQVAKLIVEVGGLQLAAARDAEGQTPVDVAGTRTRDFLKEVCKQNTEYRANSIQRSVERDGMPACTPTPLQAYTLSVFSLWHAHRPLTAAQLRTARMTYRRSSPGVGTGRSARSTSVSSKPQACRPF
jgi:ankyrin repeat protein